MVVTPIRFLTPGFSVADPTLTAISNRIPKLNPNPYSNANSSPTPQAVDPSMLWENVNPTFMRWQSLWLICDARARVCVLAEYTAVFPCVILWVSVGAHESCE